MQCAPVRCAVQTISETIGQLPIITYSRDGSGAKERAPDHPAYPLLHDAANEWTPANLFKEELTRDALLDKGGFAFINRVDDKPVELIRLEPCNVTVGRDPHTSEPTYKLTENGSERAIHWRDILHIPTPALPGSTLIRDAREAIALALVMERHAATLFANGARPSGVLKFASKLGDEAAKRIKTAWQAAHGGDKSGGTAVLEEGGEFQSLMMNSVDAQFLELRKFQIEEVARYFRMPPIFVGEYGRATWANSAEMGQQFLTYCISPWLERWQGELLLKLFTPDERKAFFAEFLTDALTKADIAKRYEAYAKAITARILSPNEARAAENRAPYAGGEKFENPNTTHGTAHET